MGGYVESTITADGVRRAELGELFSGSHVSGELVRFDCPCGSPLWLWVALGAAGAITITAAADPGKLIAGPKP